MAPVKLFLSINIFWRLVKVLNSAGKEPVMPLLLPKLISVRLVSVESSGGMVPVIAPVLSESFVREVHALSSDGTVPPQSQESPIEIDVQLQSWPLGS